MIRTYMGVRISEREAELLRWGDLIDNLPYHMRYRFKISPRYAKAQAVRDAVERCLDYRPGDPLIDRRAER